MAQARVHLQRREAIAVITMDNPETFNAMDQDMGPLLVEALEEVAADDSLRTVVLTGAGGVFCAGGNLRRAWEHLQADPANKAGEVFWGYTGFVHQAVQTLLEMPQAVVCAVEGAASGAGLAWILCSDMTVAASGAKIVPGFLGVGLTPAAGVTHLLPRAVGLHLASEMLLLNRPLSAEQAAGMGLINRTCEPGRALDTALGLAAELTETSRPALSSTKTLLNQGRVKGLHGLMAAERRATAQAADHPDFRRLVEIFFSHKHSR